MEDIKMARRTRFSELDVVKFRPVYYDGPNKKLDNDTGVDIITLYVTCKLGYSPIRHIIGAKNDKIIEDVIRQHRLGRALSKRDDGYKECRLRCPGDNNLDEESTRLITKIASKYGTIEAEYVQTMLASGRWTDDPVTSDNNKCPNCNNILDDPSYVFCPFCGERRKPAKTKKPVSID